MTDRENDLMQRYIYEVTKRLPGEQRKEIGMELEELITDMAEAEPMEEVLQKLGSPAVFAGKYRNAPRILIGPEYYDNYEWVMRIVLICVAGAIVLSELLQLILGGVRPWEMFGNVVTELAASLAGAFGMVTLVFAILERRHIKVDLMEHAKWSVEDLEKTGTVKREWTPALLPPVPDHKARISRGDCVVGLIFIVLTAVLFLFAPQWFGAYVFEDDKFVRTIPVFNMETWPMILPILLFSFLTAFADEMIRLVNGCYCRMVMVSNIISNIVQIACAYVVLKVLPFFNPDFTAEVRAEFGWEKGKWDMLSNYGTDITENIILAVIVIAALAELGTTVYKTLRYGDGRQSLT